MNYNTIAMIDWFHVATNALWILACILALSTLSYASWIASAKHQKLRNILSQSPYQTSLAIAGLLFCLGLAGSAERWWEIGLWLGLAILFIILAITSSRPGQTKRSN